MRDPVARALLLFAIQALAALALVTALMQQSARVSIDDQARRAQEHCAEVGGSWQPVSLTEGTQYECVTSQRGAK